MMPGVPVRGWSPSPWFLALLIALILFWPPFWDCHETHRLHAGTKEQTP